jgi:hypothetical protein
LTFKRPVAASILTNEELRSRVVKEIESDNPRAEIEKSAKVLRALGLLGANDDLYQILLDVQEEQVGGFYDTKAKKMVVGGDARDPSPLQRTLLAHEYTHALTDQYFDLGLLQKLSKEHKDDESEAYLSLVEGDATLLMTEYAREVLTQAEKIAYLKEAAGIKTSKLDAAPRALKSTLLFPYDEGLTFVRALYERGGNAAIDAAYRDPPASTEQILHPAKYFGRRDDPVSVSLPDIAKTLGSGWHDLIDGGVGELDVRLILGELLPGPDANDAAEGWDGGEYAAVEGSGGVVVASLTRWDSASEASEAEDAFDRWLPRRFDRAGGEKRIAGGRAWESPSGAAEVIRKGESLLLIVGPSFDSIERARGAFSGF